MLVVVHLDRIRLNHLLAHISIKADSVDQLPYFMEDRKSSIPIILTDDCRLH